MISGELEQRYESVLRQIDDACRKSGRSRDAVRLIAISKLHSAEDIALVAALGQQDFGENYVQEALGKQALLGDRPQCQKIRWHMTGHVQSRKAGQVAGAFALIHSLDSKKLADALEKHLSTTNQRQRVLIEVNVGEESQKAGVMACVLPELADYILERCPHLDLDGLMCLPPVFDAGEAARPYFAFLRSQIEDLRVRTGRKLPELSMGMSGDFAAAIAEGATMVRIGTSIFGARPVKPVAG